MKDYFDILKTINIFIVSNLIVGNNLYYFLKHNSYAFYFNKLNLNTVT